MMSSLHQIKTAIADISHDEFIELQEYIRQQALRRELDLLFADTPPEQIPAGTINIDQLRAGAEAMWGDLDDEETEAIIAAMNGKTVPQND